MNLLNPIKEINKLRKEINKLLGHTRKTGLRTLRGPRTI